MLKNKSLAWLLLLSLLVSRLAPEVLAQSNDETSTRPQALGLLKKITGGDHEANKVDTAIEEEEEEEEDKPKETIAHVRSITMPY